MEAIGALFFGLIFAALIFWTALGVLWLVLKAIESMRGRK